MIFSKKPGGFSKPRFGAVKGGPRKPFGAHEPTERFQATCNECRALCEVPFKPNGKKPIYCRNCFKGKEESPRARVQERAQGGYRSDAGSAALSRQLDQLSLKLDRLIKAVENRAR